MPEKEKNLVTLFRPITKQKRGCQNFKRKKLIQYIFRLIVLIQYILFFWEKRVICTPERESARENNRKATNSDR